MRSTGPIKRPPSLRPILLVEDNDMDLDFCLQAFEQHGVTNPVVVCRDGEAAVNFIDLHQSPTDPQLPLITLLDLRLPKVDGIEVLRHARRNAVWKKLPFVVLTTSREHVDIGAAYELGGNSYIVKPVDFNSFADVVMQLKMFWILTNEPPSKVQNVGL